MTDISFAGRRITIGSVSVDLPFEIRSAFPMGELVIVLGDPDSELRDPKYLERRSAGLPPLPSWKNLIALSLDGKLVWEAEFPNEIDCYYEIVSREPLVAATFSGFTCRIDLATGRILDWVFHK